MFDRIKKLKFVIDAITHIDIKALLDFPNWSDRDETLRWVKSLGGPIGWITSITPTEIDDEIYRIVRDHPMEPLSGLLDPRDFVAFESGLRCLVTLCDELANLTTWTQADDKAVDALAAFIDSDWFGRVYDIVLRLVGDGAAVGANGDEMSVESIVDAYLAETQPAGFEGSDDTVEFIDPMTIVAGINLLMLAIKTFREWREANPDWQPGDNLRRWMDTRREARSE